MRHGKRFNHLGRKAAHRNAMLSNMASSLIMHKRIRTTLAKAKALRKFVEPILTRSKTDSTHSRRIVFSSLQDKRSVTELFNHVAGKIANRPGGYTRILKLGTRPGDNAELCIMELVDFNELMLTKESSGKTRTRRARRGGKAKSGSTSKGDPKESGTTEVPEIAMETENSEVLTEGPVEASSEETKIKVDKKEEGTDAPEETEKKTDPGM